VGCELQMEHYEQLIKTVLKRSLRAYLISCKRINEGYGGYVFATTAILAGKKNKYIVKLSPDKTKNKHAESLDKRVYSGHPEDLESVYKLLVSHHIPTYHLFTFGYPNKEIPYYYQVTSVLEGESVREYLIKKQGVCLEELHQVCGEAFGRLHNITRFYDGRINQLKPYDLDWKNAFFKSLKNKTEKLAVLKNKFLSKHLFQIRLLISAKEKIWNLPSEYVLSDIDGLQGMAKYKKGQWLFTGHIDLEDYRFTDQRFVLAGYEIANEFEGLKIPSTFWSGYKKFKSVDPSYEGTKDLFKLYYLFSWFPMVYKANWRGKPEEKEATIKKFERAIKKILSFYFQIP